MATAAVHTLIAPARHDGIVEGFAVAIGGRAYWEIDFDIGEIVTSVDVEIEAAAAADFEFPTSLFTQQLTTIGRTTIKTRYEPEGQPADFTLNDKPHLQWLRALVTANVGDYVLACVARAPFLDNDERSDTRDLEKLSKRARTIKDPVRLQGLVEDAERDILEYFGRDRVGSIRATVDSPDFHDAIRTSISRRVDDLIQIDELSRSNRSADKEAVRRMDSGIRDMSRRPIARFRTRPSILWRGR